MMTKRRLPHIPEPQVRLRHLVLAAVVAVGAWGFLSEGMFESRLAAFGVEVEMAPESGGFITSVNSRSAPDSNAHPESEEAADALALIEEQAPSTSSTQAPDAVELEEDLDDVIEGDPAGEVENEDATAATTSTTTTTSSTTAAPRSTTAAPATTIEQPTTTVGPRVTTPPVTVVRPTTTTTTTTSTTTTTTTTIAPAPVADEVDKPADDTAVDKGETEDPVDDEMPDDVRIDDPVNAAG